MIVTEKNTKSHSTSPGYSLTARPLDLVYVIFFVTHIPATLLLDLQAIYPEWLVSRDSPMRGLMAKYISMTNDPATGGVGGYFGAEYQGTMLWLLCFMYMEMFVQLPTFFYGAYHLYHNSKLHILYPLLTFYGAATATTTLPCVALLLTAPGEGTKAFLGPVLTQGQRNLLVGSYVPYFVIPLVMAVDMAFRTSKLIARGLKDVKRE